MTAEEIAKKFTGEFPDVHGRKLAKTWDELRLLLQVEIEDLVKDENSRLLEEKAKLIEAFGEIEKLIKNWDLIISNPTDADEQRISKVIKNSLRVLHHHNKEDRIA